MTARTVDAATVLTHYEALRDTALAVGPPRAPGVGLRLLLTRGLPAWLATVTALGAGSPAPSGGAPTAGPLPHSVRAVLTTLVADMVLACRPEVPA